MPARPVQVAVVASVLAFGVIGWEHLVHTQLLAADDGADHLRHWLSDSIQALPLAAVATWGGLTLAARLRWRRNSGAALVSLLFTLLLIPSAALHDHGSGLSGLEGDRSPVGLALHGLRDAAVGQAAAFWLALFATRAITVRRPRLRVSGVRTALGTWGVIAISMVGAAPTQASATVTDPCAGSAPQKTFAVSAINVKIPLNRFGDNDPNGFMYVLDSNMSAVRAEESSQQVSIGLREDPIQPHGVAYQLGSSGTAVGNNPSSMVAPGASTTYRLFLDPAMGEGAKVVQSGGDNREAILHGLFGAIIAEPAGSSYLDPQTAKPLTGSNWEAIIQPGSGAAFREFAVILHEIGDDNFLPSTTSGGQLPQNDPFTTAYRPDGRGMNYRSEPFYDRMNLTNSTFGSFDESQGYGSYTNGDPATPMPRSYLGEPTKTRLIHGGTEQTHVYHLHGGGDRWRRNPGADPTNDMTGGLEKVPAQNATSIRLDSQAISPAESYTLEHECGAGGCQQATGDFLFHCHIAAHYVAGMWSFWRVFDTLQSDLAVIPGRTTPPTAVNSSGSLGKTIGGKTVVLQSQLTSPSTQIALETLVTSQLPPPGVRIDSQDASVWNWQKGGTATAPVYLGEPDDTHAWPDFSSSTPGVRPAVLFNPLNGRYAWPLLRPHLGQRPPFSPNGHAGAPWLGSTASTTRPDGLCPSAAPLRSYDITAITLPIQETAKGAIDPGGEIYVLNEDVAGVLAGTLPAKPLAIRCARAYPSPSARARQASRSTPSPRSLATP